MIQRYLKRPTHQCVLVKRSPSDVPVQNGLALTPAQMSDLMQRGLPISSANLGLQYEEGVSHLDFEPPLEHRRGVDINDMYEAREDVRSRFAAAYRKMPSLTPTTD